MDFSHDIAQFAEATRRDGWSPERKGRFLMLLADAGNVRLSARRCGLSAQSAYVQRRRDPLFARAWAAATVLAHRHAEHVLADRAIEGVEKEIYYRGELVGTRRRFDARLLLAHLARLDQQVAAVAEAGGQAGDVERFDELVALVAGAELPDDLDAIDGDLPLPRADYAREAAEAAEYEAIADMPAPIGAEEELELLEAVQDTVDAAYDAADSVWGGWFGTACSVADALIVEAPVAERSPAGDPAASPQDRVNVSTSPILPGLPGASTPYAARGVSAKSCSG